MHQLLEFVTSHKVITCPVCRLSIASCNCEEQITDKALTLIALEGFNAPMQHGGKVVASLTVRSRPVILHPLWCL